MKSIKTLALVTGLLAISGVSQAQFSSTWTAVSDYDFRGVSQSGKDPALQASADYAFSNGLSIGAWASNIDFGNDEDIELDLYLNYAGKINDTFSWTAGGTLYMYPDGDAQDDYPEIYVGFNAGAFSFKQWYSRDYVALPTERAVQRSELHRSDQRELLAGVPCRLRLGRLLGWPRAVRLRRAGNFTAGNFTIFGKFTGTDASGAFKIEDDVVNNEARASSLVS